jgi:sec-independent protein translocase protein TatA
MFGLGLPEMIVIGIIILLIFGARRLPEIGKGLGKTVKEIRGISKDTEADKGEKRKQRDEVDKPPEGDEGKTSVIDDIKPLARDIKEIKEKADKLRKWSRLLR